MTHAPLARRGLRAGLAGLLTAALAGSALATVPSASAAPHREGTTDLASVLAADGNRFDRNWADYDILDRAVRQVLKADPNSPVKVLTQGRTRATAFLPSDRAFAKLVRSLSGKTPANEKAAYRALVKTVDLDTIETVLLYHVVPGKTLTAKKVIARDGKKLQTAAEVPVTVRVRGAKVFLADRDPDARNAQVVVPNINKGNRQIAHGINQVLRPANL